jgi:hypothetical protein
MRTRHKSVSNQNKTKKQFVNEHVRFVPPCTTAVAIGVRNMEVMKLC